MAFVKTQGSGCLSNGMHRATTIPGQDTLKLLDKSDDICRLLRHVRNARVRH